MEIDGLFIEIGSEPEYGLIEKLNLKTDDLGFIIVEKIKKQMLKEFLQQVILQMLVVISTNYNSMRSRSNICKLSL